MFLYKAGTDIECPACREEVLDWCEQDEVQFDAHYPDEFYQCPECGYMEDENGDVIQGDWDY